MRLVIIPEENKMGIDGVYRRVDCSELVKKGIHAIQWYDNNEGEIEFKGTLRDRKPNEYIKDISRFKDFILNWNTADDYFVHQQVPPKPA